MTMTMTSASLLFLSIAGLFLGCVESFVPHRSIMGVTTGTTIASADDSTTTALQATSTDRRGFFATVIASAAGGSSVMMSLVDVAMAEQSPEYRQGIQVNAFNGLIFNYRGGDFGGLEATTLQEPSVSYAEFNTRLQAGEVAFVEFMAPDGDAAYVTFKAKDGQSSQSTPIRIGEGYPIEQHDGYSSPMFCVRAVKNAGVPYKFTVPALAKLNH